MQRDGETQGAFTVRAYAAHVQHVSVASAPKASQCGLFDSQTDLFGDSGIHA